jgi:hypothetical protein
LPAPRAIAAADSRGGLTNWLLPLLVVVLAFLTASFIARNSDFWFHLATGRLLAQGQMSFGDEPFTYTAGHVYWANHAWLFDLGLYHLHDLIGGEALVVLKALLVASLAGLLLRIRRPGSGPWLAVVATALALLAMSPRLLLQPVCLSYFLLGLTLWLLWTGSEGATSTALQAAHPGIRQWVRRLPRAAWCLPVLVLWVNVDEWFLLGPMLMALFWLGERLQGHKHPPGWLVPAGLAACLVNPHTFHVFTLPHEVSPVAWTSGLWDDARFQPVFTAVWQPAYLDGIFTRPNPAALAYFALLLLGLLSFLGQRQALRSWRLVVWLPFALLATAHARAIPFFAIVAAPITVLNGQDALAPTGYAAAPRARGQTPRLAAVALRFALAVSLLVLIVLTWPGWLARDGRNSRHVAWGVQADPSLQRAAETLHFWRSHGLLRTGERMLPLSPEAAHYTAWFCPGEKYFLDHRFGLFADVAQDYETVCRRLLPDLVPLESNEPEARELDPVLRNHHVGIVIVHDREPQRLFDVLPRLARDRLRWTLLYVAGDAVLAGWNKARPPPAFVALAFDPDRLAFGPQDERSRRELPAAPEQGLAKLPVPPDLREDFWDFWVRVIRPPLPPTWESAAASVYLHYFDDYEPWHGQQRLHTSLRAFAATLAGLPALPDATSPPTFPLAAPQVAAPLLLSGNLLRSPGDAAQRFLVRDQLGPFFARVVERPPALPLLAIRAGRRAVAVNPEDANAWLRLGQAYLDLRNLTCEHSGEGLLPPLAQLRHVQVVSALEQAVRLDPDLEQAHHELAHLYGGHNYLDQALVHQRRELDLSRRAGPRQSESADDFADRLELLEKDTAKLEELVEDRRQKFAAAARQLQGQRPAQANLALRLGLTRQALEEQLMPTPAELLGPPGIRLELELLLLLGRVNEVRDFLDDEVLRTREHKLGSHTLPAPLNRQGHPLYGLPYLWPAYDWLHALEASARGDYAAAAGALRAVRRRLRASHDRMMQRYLEFGPRTRTWLPPLLAGPPSFLPAFAATALGRLVDERTLLQAGAPILRAQQADLLVLEALLALERGNPEAARSAFLQADKQSAQLSGQDVRFAGAPIAAVYLRYLHGNGR